MFSKCNATNIKNEIESGAIQGQSGYCCKIINCFACYLKKEYKGEYAINNCIKNVEQYINWYSLNNTNNYLILSRSNYSKYGYYLLNSKRYKASTISIKLISLRKLNKFLIGFNRQNSTEEFSNHININKNQYNYLTESYIRL